MCEYDPECSKSNDSQALALWSSDYAPLLTVRCPNPENKHSLAKVYQVLGRACVCLRPMALRASYLGSDEPGETVHLHAQLIPLNDVTWLDYGRCGHGTFGWEPDLLKAALMEGRTWVEARPTEPGPLGSRGFRKDTPQPRRSKNRKQPETS